MDRAEIAIEYYKKHFNCAQAVLASFKDEFDIPEKVLLKISTGFGGGMAEMQLVCGAITGAFMVIGLKQGRSEVEDVKSKEFTYSMIDDFTEKFVELNKFITCKELLGCDFYTEEGRKLYLEKNARVTVCYKCVRDSVNILEDVLNS